MPNSAARKRARRLLELGGICLVAALLGVFVFPRLPVFPSADLIIQDKLVEMSRVRPHADEFVFVAIDDASMKLDQLWPEDIAASPTLQAMSGPDNWPWPRNVWADAIDKILGAGAKVVLLDLIFDKPRNGDDALKRVLDAHRNQVVIGANFITDNIAPDHRGFASIVPNLPATTLIADPANDPRVGFVNFWPDPVDRVVRAAPYGVDRLGQHLDSFGAAGLRLAGYANRIPSSNVQHPFRFVDLESIRTVSFFSLFVASDWKRTLGDGAIFKDKIVIIGPTATVMHDEHIVPGQQKEIRAKIPGPLLHLNAIAAALHGDFYQRATPGVARCLTLFAAALAWLLVVRLRRRPIPALLALLGVCALYLAAALLVLGQASYALPFAPPATTLLVAGVACIAWNFARERRESGRMRSMLERYVSRNLVREVLDHRDDFLGKLGGTRQPVTVLFSDVRGFTSFSEREDASSVVEQLNEYLGEMVGVIFRRKGTVDKFMGDGIMAVWGNVVSEGPSTDARHAVATAWEMLERLDALNARWAERELRPFRIGIGLHHGDAVFGNIGSAEKMEPTVIGDTVNLASRVEGLTKKYGVALCITQPLAELVNEHFLLRTVDLVQVVGKSRPVEILTVVGPRATAEMPAWMKRYEGAVADFRARRFVEAAETLRTCVAEAPDDKLCALYLRRAETFLAEPPPEDWTGTEIATSK
jgi:adenylate cyclase